MPSRNIVKVNIKDGYYHIYNRGVDKRKIFVDKHDYEVFLKYLKEYLSPPANKESMKVSFSLKGSTFKGLPKQTKNFSKEIELVAYCLMPNHFHLLIKQFSEGSMKSFMQALATRYVMYFNTKNDRLGPLFQGVYRAALVQSDEYLLHLSRYIHLNPTEITSNIASWYSSYADYLGIRKTKWVNPKIVLEFFENAKNEDFKHVNSYRKFVEDYNKDSSEILGKLTLE